MQHIPRQTVTAWIDQKKKLDPRRLIPALVHYHQQGKSTQVHKDKGEDIFLNLSYISQSKSVRVAENIIENATPSLKDTLVRENYNQTLTWKKVYLRFPLPMQDTQATTNQTEATIS